MREAYYRLGDLKIIQSGGALWWEAHTGVGAFRSGKCYIISNILFLGPSEREEPGHLKREFLESIQEFPKWFHTRYYCSNYSIHDCRSGRKFIEEELSQWSDNRTPPIEGSDSVGRTPTEGPDPTDATSYKVGQHEVTKKTDGQWWWRTHSGSGGLREGRCLVAGNILFFGAGETEETGNLKHSFIERLSHLPQWKTTKYYCPSAALYDCRTGMNLLRQEGVGGVITPPAGAVASCTLFSNSQRRSSMDPTLSLIKELAGNAVRAVHRRVDEAGQKFTGWLKIKNMGHCKIAPDVPVHRLHIKECIARGGAFIWMTSRLLFAFSHRLWKKWQCRHRTHDHSPGDHRHHSQNH